MIFMGTYHMPGKPVFPLKNKSNTHTHPPTHTHTHTYIYMYVYIYIYFSALHSYHMILFVFIAINFIIFKLKYN